MESSDELTYEEVDFISDLEKTILDENVRWQVSIRSESAKIGRSRDWLDRQLMERFQKMGNLDVYNNWKSRNRNKRK